MATATRTVLFTDLANYTAAVAGSDREGLRRILKEHQELVQPIVSRYGGRIVKNLGDSYMCLFHAATDGLRAALDIQDLVEGENAIRLASATGDVEEIDGDAFGEVVNLAARILGKTPAGEVWFADGTRKCMNAAEIPWESVGRFRLKGIPGEPEVYRAVPHSRSWLPMTVFDAVKANNLVRIKRGHPMPILSSDPVVLFEGYIPGSPALEATVDQLPVLEPGRLWISTYNISPTDRWKWEESGRGIVIGTPEAVSGAIQAAKAYVTRSSGSDTIVLDVGRRADVELLVRGLALPAVPLSDVVASYFYELLPDGRWVSRSDRSVLRVEVLPDGVYVVPQSAGVSMNGRSLAPGAKTIMNDGAALTTAAGALEFRASTGEYAGLMLGDSPLRLGVSHGQTAELGREPNHPGIAFPERRGRENIRWCSGSRAARARQGGFTLDRALAGRHQASVSMLADMIQVTPLHDRCPTFVMRDDTRVLFRIMGPTNVGLDDLVVAGTTVIGMRNPEDE